MITYLNKIFLKSKKSNSLNLAFKKIKIETGIEKIFKSIEDYSADSEIRYVGGCIRKIINNEKVDDIDLAVNLKPNQVIEALKKDNIRYYETGIDHGTITAVVKNNKFEITSLRKDILTDGRHAKVEFSEDWLDDASRRDFTINSIYSDIEGNLFDPFDGKNDLESGKIKFIGDSEKRIKEDYLRILRYLRFYLNYSKKEHDIKTVKVIKKNLDGVSKISPERLLDEFKKLAKSKGFLNLSKDKFCSEIVQLIFPQFKNITIFKNPNDYVKKNIYKTDFVILISLMIIEDSDNVDYFLYKFNLSNNDKKRILFLNKFFSSKVTKKTFLKKNLQKILYLKGRQALLDVLYFDIFKSKKIDKKILEMIELFKTKEVPVLPLKAKNLMIKYNIPEGKELGLLLKKIEEKWMDNNFTITEDEIQNLVEN
jgi:tRNA nucleotidyltransferase/poly(A) polymerase